MNNPVRLLASASFLVAVLGAVSFATLADHNSEASLEKRIAAVGSINVMTEEQAAEAAKIQAEAMAASQADAGPVDGAEIYQSACTACHTAGIAGAPKLGDAGIWGPRVAQGLDVLIEHAINGYQGEGGVMPARGGNASLSDEQVAAAVEYIVEESK